jgi:hypothetical protein
MVRLLKAIVAPSAVSVGGSRPMIAAHVAARAAGSCVATSTATMLSTLVPRLACYLRGCQRRVNPGVHLARGE